MEITDETRKSLVGGYTTKVPLVELYDYFKEPLAMIAVVHVLGAQKYPAYSWFNDPTEGNSTITDNIEAIGRHMGAHMSGHILDREGLPHIFHMCCRAGMMVSIRAKALSPLKLELQPAEGMDHRYYDLGMWLTPTELYELQNYEVDVEEVSNLDSAKTLLNIVYLRALAAINEYTKGPHRILSGGDIAPNIRLDVTEDHLHSTLTRLYTIIMLYAKFWWNEHKAQAYFSSKLPEQVTLMVERYLLDNLPEDNKLEANTDDLKDHLFDSTGVSSFIKE